MIPKWLHNKRLAVFDLETDFIPTTLIYMNGVAFIDIDNFGEVTITPSKTYTYKWAQYSNGSLLESMALLQDCDFLVGHNLIGFDIQQVRQHLGIALTTPVLDTLILSKIIFSKDELYAIDISLGILEIVDWTRPYALDAFGKRLGDNKIVFKEFDKMTEEMQIYCDQDVNLTSNLLLFLLSKENFPLEAVITIEHQAATIIAEQERFGFYLDIEKTRELNTKLLTEKLSLATELSTIFHPKWLKDGKEKAYKKKSIVRKYLPNKNYIPLIGTKE